MGLPAANPHTSLRRSDVVLAGSLQRDAIAKPQNPIDTRPYRYRPLNPNGENWLYGMK